MDSYQKIIGLAKIKPVNPSDVAKAIGTNMIMASAMLSELKSRGILRISYIKIGSSPLYYSPEKKEMLQEYANHLNEKEKKVFELIKEKKVLKDEEADTLTRLCLKQIKDFAQPIEVSQEGKTELYWKWYLTSNEEAGEIIKRKTVSPSQTLKNKESQETKEFLGLIRSYFRENNVQILTETPVRKNKEYEHTISIESSFGKLTYYCRTKDKKSITDSDINNAFAQAQIKKLPFIFLTTGQLTKKAKKLVEEIRGMKFKQLKWE